MITRLLFCIILLCPPLVTNVEKISCFGDSNTEGYGVSKENSWCSQIKGLNFGVGGDSSREALRRVKDVAKAKPKKVVVMLGTGDAYDPDGDGIARISLREYRSNMGKILRALRKKKIILMSPLCTLDSAFNSRLKSYVEASRKLARKYKVRFLGNFRPCTKAGHEYFTDYAHISVIGHLDIATRLKRYL